jgi:uncharacterized membrane protein YqgA involved in biofilm formation
MIKNALSYILGLTVILIGMSIDSLTTKQLFVLAVVTGLLWLGEALWREGQVIALEREVAQSNTPIGTRLAKEMGL